MALKRQKAATRLLLPNVKNKVIVVVVGGGGDVGGSGGLALFCLLSTY